MQNYLVLIDAHVHIHKIFEIDNFFDAAFNNFKENAYKIAPDSLYEGVLCLTESEGENYFESFLNNYSSSNKFPFLKTREDNSLICINKDGAKIFIIAGRQIVTKERLEVLGIGLREQLNDGNSIKDVIDFVLLKKALPVIPWGAGKWIGRRGHIVNDLINQSEIAPLFVGDNSNRTYFWKKPKIFTKNRTNALNLSGTDPLPFKEEENRPGNFGFYISGFLSEKEPYNDLRERLVNSKDILYTYGKLENPLRFLKNQIRMQIIKK